MFCRLKLTQLITVIITIFAVVVLSACTAPAERGTEVTRFHLNKPIAPQTVRVDPGEGMQADSIEFNTYREMVVAELSALGFDVVEDDTASLSATIRVTRQMQQVAPKSSGVRVGFGMGSYGGGSGVSGGVSAPVGGRKGGEVFATTLGVQLVDTAESAVVWEGEAVNTAAASPGRPTAAVRALAAALFTDFPGESGKTVTVDGEGEN